MVMKIDTELGDVVCVVGKWSEHRGKVGVGQSMRVGGRHLSHGVMELVISCAWRAQHDARMIGRRVAAGFEWGIA